MHICHSNTIIFTSMPHITIFSFHILSLVDQRLISYLANMVKSPTKQTCRCVSPSWRLGLHVLPTEPPLHTNHPHPFASPLLLSSSKPSLQRSHATHSSPRFCSCTPIIALTCSGVVARELRTLLNSLSLSLARALALLLPFPGPRRRRRDKLVTVSGNGEPAGAVLRDPQHLQGHAAQGNQGGVQDAGAAMAPRQAPAVVQERGRGPLQGHHRGLRGDPDRYSFLFSLPLSLCMGVQEAGVQLHGPRRGRRLRAARLRRVLELRGAQGAGAGTQGGVHPRGALHRVQEGGEVHPRRRHQDRADFQEGGDEDDQGEARVEEGDEGDVRGHGRRAAGLPAGRRRVHHLREEAQGVQEERQRPGAQGRGAAGERAHRLVLLLPPHRRREDELLLPRRGHLPGLREGRRG
uniref:Uncharacterized protein n=1 Tax=Oryza brachyantha TaxID=4533 RepID=J3M7E1_ORYBR